MIRNEEKPMRYVVSETGREESTCTRRYVVEVSNGVDADMLDGERMSQAADEAGVGWEMPEYDDSYHDGYNLEGLADEMECDDLPVIRLDIDCGH